MLWFPQISIVLCLFVGLYGVRGLPGINSCLFQSKLNINYLSDCNVCDIFNPKTVKIRARNILKAPMFEAMVQLNCTRSKTLFNMLQEAAAANSLLRFSVTYFGGDLGYFVDAINRVRGDWNEDKSYWEILDGSLKQTQLGVSSYVPRNGETVTFNLTRG